MTSDNTLPKMVGTQRQAWVQAGTPVVAQVTVDESRSWSGTDGFFQTSRPW